MTYEPPPSRRWRRWRRHTQPGCQQWQAERKASVALRAALEQPEQPVAWLESPYGSIRMNTTMRFQFPPQSLKWKIPLYTHPPRREWQGLSEEEIAEIALQSQDGFSPHDDTQRFAQAIEAKLKEKSHEH